jgi:hypothetical protein
MRRARLGVVSLIFAGLCACEPTPVAAPPQPKPVDVAAPVDPSATAAAGPDLAPVTEPADIVGLGRWRSPMTTAANLASCAGIAPVIVEVNARMGVDALLRQYMRSGDTRKLAGLVALDAPVDVVVSLDPDERPRPPRYAVAIGLTSLDGALVAIDEEARAPELSPGVWKVKGARGASCGVAASAGQTPARLVCADKEKTLAALAPYLARTMPGLDLGGPDLHVEARVNVLEKRYGASLRNLLRVLPSSFATEYGSGEPRYDRLLFESGMAVQDDAGKLLADVQRVTAEARSASSGTCLRATADVDLAGKTSWLAQTLTDRLDRSGPPPAIYWRQPKDSEVALYGRGVDAARFSAVITRLRELLDASLAADGFAAADRKKITELVDLPLGKDTTMVLSHGAVSAPMPAAGGKDAEKKIIEAGFAGLAGWTMIGVDQGPDVLKKQLKAMVDAYKLAGVQSVLKKTAGSDAKLLPVVKATAAPASLGAGSEAFQITMSNIPVPPPHDAAEGHKPQTMSLTFHVLLMPDGDSTWLALGAVKDELVKRLAAAKTAAADKDQLASRAGLDPLRNGKQMLGGFVSGAAAAQKIWTVITGVEAIDPGTFGKQAPSLAQALAGMPNHGQTPVFVTWNGAPGAATTRLSLAIDLQQGSFEDTRSLAVSAYGFFQRLGWLP